MHTAMFDYQAMTTVPLNDNLPRPTVDLGKDFLSKPPRCSGVTELSELRGYAQLETEYDPAFGALHCTMVHESRPCFTDQLLRETADMQSWLTSTYQNADDAHDFPLNYVISRSSTSGHWNLGGDLELFAHCIRSQNRGLLREYAHRCVNVLYPYIVNFSLPTLSIAVIDGDALGGGFEAALAHDIIIAEEQVRMGLPEILFNLFPGMGAFSLLARRLGQARAKRMIMSGKLYSARELYDLGIVDVVAAEGEADTELRRYLKRNRPRHTTELALAQAAKQSHPLSYEELIDITNLWVDAAMALTTADLKKMDRIVNSQKRIYRG